MSTGVYACIYHAFEVADRSVRISPLRPKLQPAIGPFSIRCLGETHRAIRVPWRKHGICHPRSVSLGNRARNNETQGILSVDDVVAAPRAAQVRGDVGNVLAWERKQTLDRKHLSVR